MIENRSVPAATVIPVLSYEDIGEASRWLCEVFGFGGMILTTARCLGEFGAVAVVSGHIQGETETATLRVEERYQSLDLAGAYAISIVLAVLAVLVLVAMTVIRPKEEAVRVHRRRGRTEALRRFRRARQRLAGDPDRLADRAARPERWRQVHPAPCIAGLEQPDAGTIEI